MTVTLRAAYQDGLVLGIGETDAKAMSDLEEQVGTLDEGAVDLCYITDKAAAYVRNGGDQRALTFLENYEDCGCWAMAPAKPTS